MPRKLAGQRVRYGGDGWVLWPETPLTGAQRVARHKQRKAEEQARRDAALLRIYTDPTIKTIKQARMVACEALGVTEE
jgi:hypothetical protein